MIRPRSIRWCVLTLLVLAASLGIAGTVRIGLRRAAETPCQVSLIFELGTIWISNTAQERLTGPDARPEDRLGALLERHSHGDWGNVPSLLRQSNDANARAGRGAIYSLYDTPAGRVTIETADFPRGRWTTVLVPAEDL